MIFNNIEMVPEVTDSRFLMFNDGSIECETGELLFGFIRRLKPQNILETGCYKGWGSAYMAKAVEENGFGHVETLEIDTTHIESAQGLWNKLGLRSYISAIHSDSLKFTPNKQYQFMFLDSEPWLRFQELVKFYPNLDEGGYIFVHDMPNSLCQGNINPDHPDFKSWPVGDVPQEFKDLLHSRKLMPFYFGGARGLVGFYRVHSKDYI